MFFHKHIPYIYSDKNKLFVFKLKCEVIRPKQYDFYSCVILPLEAEFISRVVVVRERMQLREQEIHGTWLTETKMAQKNYSQFLGLGIVIKKNSAAVVFHRSNFENIKKGCARALDGCLSILSKEGHPIDCEFLLQISQHIGSATPLAGKKHRYNATLCMYNTCMQYLNLLFCLIQELEVRQFHL